MFTTMYNEKLSQSGFKEKTFTFQHDNWLTECLNIAEQ